MSFALRADVDLDLDALLDALADRVADRIVTRLAEGNGPAPTRPGDDKLLGVQEAAGRLGVKPKWLYRNAGKLPFTVKLPGRGVRFNETGLTRWMHRRQRGS